MPRKGRKPLKIKIPSTRINTGTIFSTLTSGTLAISKFTITTNTLDYIVDPATSAEIQDPSSLQKISES